MPTKSTLPEQFWRCVLDTYLHDDAPGLNEDDWRSLFDDFYSRAEARTAMSEAERAALASLPDPLPVFRGFTRDGGESGFAWTLDRQRAEWFAVNYHDGQRMRLLYDIPDDDVTRQARVAIGVVAKRDVIAYPAERQESEVVALPENVSILSIEGAR